MEQDSTRKTLGEYLQDALATSRNPLEYLTLENLEGFKPLLLKKLENVSFLSKHRVAYQVRDFYFSEDQLKIRGRLLDSGSFRIGCAPMSLPMHIKDPEYTPVPINPSNCISLPFDPFNQTQTIF